MAKGTGHTKGSDGLTNQERYFLRTFFLTGNKRGAAKEAYNFSGDKNADNKAAKILDKPEAKVFLSGLTKETIGSENMVADQAKKVIDELALIAFSDIREYVDHLDLPESLRESIKGLGPQAKAISEISYDSTGIPNTEFINTKAKIKFNNKISALDLLGKYHKLFTQTIDLNAKVESPVKWTMPDNGMSEPVDQ